MTRVLFVQSSLAMGGAEMLLLTLMRTLDRQIIEPSVATLGFHEGPLAEELEEAGITVHRLDVGRFRRLHRAVIATMRLATLAANADVVVSYSVHAHILARPAAWLAGKPNILMMHTILEQPLSCNELSARLAIGLGATCVVANSEATAKSARRWFHRSRVERIYNGIDVDRFKNAFAERYRWGFPHGLPVVACIARLQQGKGHSTFIKAAERLRGRAHFVVVGETQFNREAEYRETLAHQAAAAGVALLGFIPELHSFYKACDIVVLPSESPEAFGLVLAEAMAAGVPVIGTRSGGPPEVIGDAGMIVPPANPDALTAAISELLRSPEHRQQLATRGVERVASHFSAESMAREWENLLQHPRRSSALPGHC